jgi:DNA-binding HxlR family transcriptional regulator
MNKNNDKVNSLDKAVTLVGKKFDLLIIDSISRNKNKARFNHILNDIPSSNPRILSMRLKDLEKNKLIEKHLIIGTPVKTEYSLTHKAEQLIEIIDKLKKWVETN